MKGDNLTRDMILLKEGFGEVVLPPKKYCPVEVLLNHGTGPGVVNETEANRYITSCSNLGLRVAITVRSV